MLLAAGRGSRLRPLTDSTPKPLIEVGQRPLLQWHLEALARQPNIHRVCINTAWLGEDITDYFGDRFQLQDFLSEGADPNAVHPAHNRAIGIHHSTEGKTFGKALETAGGICHALPQLADTFWLAAGDALMPDFAFAESDYNTFAASEALAHIWLVPNPAFKETGDFGIGADGFATLDNAPDTSYTYSTVGLFKKALFTAPCCTIPSGNPDGIELRLADVLRPAIADQKITASLYSGYWEDVGTAERLASARRHMHTWKPSPRTR